MFKLSDFRRVSTGLFLFWLKLLILKTKSNSKTKILIPVLGDRPINYYKKGRDSKNWNLILGKPL